MSKQKSKIFAIFIFMLLFLASNKITTKASSSSPKYAGIVKTSYGSLNVRSGASVNSNIISSLKSGTYISIIEKENNFYKVLYGSNKTGYCHKDYINTISNSYGAYVNTTSTSLNIRNGPSTSHKVVSKLPKNEEIVVLSTYGDFHKILYRGSSIGYASVNYIEKSTANKTISLNIPSYKQYDERWKNIQLGNSSKTILQSGCLTTAIAMEKSYFYGYSVTPANVARSEKYTSGGSIYWPKEYSFIYSNDLKKFKELILNGTAVIVGAKNAYGSQHWVIITGYMPNGTITADDFVINDPGSSTRSRLNTFYNAYNLFYKAAYRTMN